jgi:hypothetical protein
MNEGKLTLGQAIDQVEKALASFDGPDQQTILAAVCSHLKIGAPAPLVPAPPPVAAPAAEVAGRRFVADIDIKTLKEQKQPSSATQMACVVAYYLAELVPETERKTSVTVADLEKYFKQAGYPLRQKMEQLLVDAKRAGYFESEARGEYSLNRVGHNLVAHKMPSGGKE